MVARNAAVAWFGALLFGLTSACSPTAPPTAYAALHAARGRPDEAARVLRARLVQAPEDAEARRELVRVLGSLRRLDEAEAEAERLRELLGETSPIPLVELGHAFELAHRYAEALELYDGASELAPNDPLGPRTGGLRAARWGELEWAEPRLVEALRRNISDATIWHALGLVRVHQGRLKEAESAYRSGLAQSPRSFENRIGLATIALQRHDWGAALHEYDAIAADWPDHADAHLGRAYVLWRMGHVAAARAALERARVGGADPRALSRLERAVGGDVVEQREGSSTKP